MLKISTLGVSLKITNLKLHPHHPGANELTLCFATDIDQKNLLWIEDHNMRKTESRHFCTFQSKRSQIAIPHWNPRWQHSDTKAAKNGITCLRKLRIVMEWLGKINHTQDVCKFQNRSNCWKTLTESSYFPVYLLSHALRVQTDGYRNDWSEQLGQIREQLSLGIWHGQVAGVCFELHFRMTPGQSQSAGVG